MRHERNSTNYNLHTKQVGDESGGACSMHERVEIYMQYFNQKMRRIVGVHWRSTLKWSLKKMGYEGAD
jgi:hypothetical protein